MNKLLIMEKLNGIGSYSRRIMGVLLLLGTLILSGLVISTLARDIPIWFFGSEAKATIVDLWTDKYPDDFNPVYYLDYEFTTSSGENITGTSRVPGNEWVTYMEGSEITVKYSKQNPRNNRLDDSRYMPFLFCSYIPFFLFCWFALALGKEMVE